MGIILVAPAVVAPIAAGAAGAGAAGAGAAAAGFAAKFLGATAISTAVSFVASALQPKVSSGGGETGGRMVSVSNSGVDPRIVIFGRFRESGTLIWHNEYGDERQDVTQIIQICDLPIEAYLIEIADGEVVSLISNNSQTVRGHAGPGFNDAGDDPQLTALDFVPIVASDGAPGDFWRQTPTVEFGPLWYHYSDQPEDLERIDVAGSPPAVFHDLASSNPADSLGENYDVAVNRATGDVFWKRGGRWRKKAKTSATAGIHDNRLIESSEEPGEHSRFLHWEDGDDRWRWHFKVRYLDGTQTAADPYAIHERFNEGGQWNSSFKGLSRAYKVVTQRFYPDIYPGSFPVQTASIVLGIKVFDPRRAATGTNVDWYGTTVKSNQIAWTDNAALIAAFVKCWPELPGAVPYSEIDEDELIASANICDQTITNPDGSTEPRYTINGMIQSTESRDSVEDALEIALGGHIFRRGGKWVIWAGRARSTTMTVELKNVVGTDYDYQESAGLRERKNRVIGTYFSPAHNYLQVSMHPVQVAAYVTADAGQKLQESIHFRFAARTRFTPRRLAQIWLHAKRAQANMLSINLDVEALDLSPLDVLEFTENFLGFTTTRFVVSEIASPYLSPLGGSGEDPVVQCKLFAYNPNTWDAPTENPTEPGFELPKVRNMRKVGAPLSIEVVKVNRRGIVDNEGFLLANVVIKVGRSRDPRAEEYELQYRMANETFSIMAETFGNGSDFVEEREWSTLSKAPSGEKPEFFFQIKSLYDTAYYDFRVRSLNRAGAASDSYTSKEWKRQIDGFQIVTGAIGPGRPSTAILGNNEVANPNFKQKSLSWEYESAASGSTVWDDTGGRFGSESTKIEIVSHTRRIRPDKRELVAAEVGQRWRFRFWRRITQAGTGDSSDTNISINVQYYGTTGATDFISSTQVASLTTTSGTHGYEIVTGHHTVPDNHSIKFMRLQAAANFVNGPYTARFDAFQQKRVLGATSSVFRPTDELNENDAGNGLNWNTIRSITVGKPGDPVTIRFSFAGRVGDAGSLITGNASLRVRVQRFDADGVSGENNMLPAETIGDTIEPGTNWGPWQRHALDCIDDSKAAGTYVYEAQFTTNRTNAKAAVRERVISWELNG